MQSAAMLSKYPIISEQVSREQLQIILDELERVLLSDANGAVIEFGCYIGTTSLFIQRILDAYHDQREFHVYDSFQGLPAKSTEDQSPAGEQFQAGALYVSRKAFIHEFQKANLKLPIIHKGWFSELTDQDVPDKIAFAFLDGDFYKSIRDSLKLVVPRMQPGGIIVIDDYAREALPGVARAVHSLALNLHIIVHSNLGIIRYP